MDTAVAFGSWDSIEELDIEFLETALGQESEADADGASAASIKQLDRLAAESKAESRHEDAVDHLRGKATLEQEEGLVREAIATRLDIGRILLANGNARGASTDFQVAEEEARKAGHGWQRLLARKWWSRALERRGRRDEARKVLAEGIEQARRTRSARGEAMLLQALARIHERSGRLGLAIDALKEAEHLRRRLSDDTYLVFVLDALGRTLLRRGSFALAEEALTEAIEKAEELELLATQARLLLRRATARRQRRPDLAAADESAALTVIDTLSSSRWREAVRLRLAETRVRTGDRDAARRDLDALLGDSDSDSGSRGRALLAAARLSDDVETWSKALEEAERIGGESRNQRLLAEIHLCRADRLGRSAEAVGVLEKAVDLLEACNANERLLFAFDRLGRTLVHVSRYQEAREVFERSVEAGRAIGDERHVAFSLNGLAFAMQREGRLDEAADTMRRSYEAGIQLADYRHAAVSARGLGWIHRARDDGREAVRWFEEAAERAEQVDDLELRVPVLRHLAMAYRSVGDLEAAALTEKRCSDESSRIGDTSSAVAALYRRLRDIGRTREASDVVQLIEETGLRELDEVGSPPMELLVHAGSICKERRLFAQAETFFRRALQDDNRGGTDKTRAIALHCLGDLCLARGSFDEAERLLEEAAAATSDDRGFAIVRHTQARALAERGDVALGLERAREALALAEKSGDRSGAAMIANTIGTMLTRTGQYDEAEDQFRYAVQLEDGVGNRLGRVKVLTSLANLMIRGRRFRQAIDVLEPCVSVERDQGTPRGHAMVLYRLASAYLRVDLERGLELLEESLEVAEAAGLRLHQAYTLKSKGDALARVGRTDQALRALERSLEIAVAEGDAQHLDEVRRVLAGLYRELNRPRVAMEFWQKLKESGIERGEHWQVFSATREIVEQHQQTGNLDSAMTEMIDCQRAAESLATTRGDLVPTMQASRLLASLHLARGDKELGLDCLRRTVESAAESGARREFVAALSDECKALVSMDRTAEALAKLDAGLDDCETALDERGFHALLGQQRRIHEQDNDHNGSLRAARSGAERLARWAGGDLALVARHNVANALYSADRHEEAIAEAREVIKEADAREHRWLRSDTRNVLARALDALGRRGEAIEALKEAALLCDPADSFDGLKSVLRGLSVLLREESREGELVAIYRDQAEAAGARSDHVERAIALKRLAVYYSQSPESHLALDVLAEAAAAAENSQDLGVQSLIDFAAGRILSNHGELERAIGAYGRCIDVREEYGRHGHLGVLASAYKERGRSRRGLSKPADDAQRRELLAAAEEDLRRAWELGVLVDQDHHRLGTAVTFGAVLADNRRNEEAVEILEEGRALLTRVDDPSNEENVLHQLGRAYLFTGRLAEAVRVYSELLELKATRGHLVARAHFDLGNALRRQYRLEEARAHLLTSLRKCEEEAGTREIHVNQVWAALGRCDRAAFRYEDALTWYDKVLELTSREQRDKGGRFAYGIARVSRGSLLRDMERIPGAIEDLEEAWTHFSALGSNRWRSTAGNVLCLALHEAGRNEDAISIGEEALEIARADRDEVQVSVAANNVAEVYRRQGHTDRAEELLQLAAELASQSGAEVNLPYIYRRLGKVRRDRGDPDAAIDFFERGADIARSLFDRERLAKCLIGAAGTHAAAGELEKATSVYREARDLSRSIGFERLVALTEIELSALLRQTGDTEAAERSAAEGVRIAGLLKKRGIGLRSIWTC